MTDNGRARVLFVVDAGAEVGGGHVMRALTLAGALADRGCTCAFLAPPAVRAVLDAFADARIERLDAATTAPGALVRAAADARGFSAVAFDHFRLSRAEQSAAAAGRPCLVVDDLADRPLHADLLLDPGPARRPEDYDGLLPEGAGLLLGPAYALVRPEFAAGREAALRRRAGDGALGRVLVSLGLTDVGAIAARVVDRLLPRLGDARLDVVLGAAAASRATLERLAERDARMTVHVETRDMAALMAAADLAVGAGGSAAWERCTLGLPTVLLVQAENQEPAAKALAERGAAEVVDARAEDFDAAFDRAFLGLARSPERRAKLSRISAGLCDGQGAGRVADAFLSLLGTRT